MVLRWWLDLRCGLRVLSGEIGVGEVCSDLLHKREGRLATVGVGVAGRVGRAGIGPWLLITVHSGKLACEGILKRGQGRPRGRLYVVLVSLFDHFDPTKSRRLWGNLRRT